MVELTFFTLLTFWTVTFDKTWFFFHMTYQHTDQLTDKWHCHLEPCATTMTKNKSNRAGEGQKGWTAQDLGCGVGSGHGPWWRVWRVWTESTAAPPTEGISFMLSSSDTAGSHLMDLWGMMFSHGYPVSTKLKWLAHHSATKRQNLTYKLWKSLFIWLTVPLGDFSIPAVSCLCVSMIRDALNLANTDEK